MAIGDESSVFYDSNAHRTDWLPQDEEPLMQAKNNFIFEKCRWEPTHHILIPMPLLLECHLFHSFAAVLAMKKFPKLKMLEGRSTIYLTLNLLIPGSEESRTCLENGEM